MRRGQHPHGRLGARGQSVTELALILPVLLMLLLGLLEFGLAFDHLLSLSYATREGARTGAALVNGGGPMGCGSGGSPNADTVDSQIVAAVERVLTSPGSQVALERIEEIRIYRANASGGEQGSANRWVYAAASGPTVDGAPLDFRAVATPWAACSRTNSLPAPSIGVAIRYRYAFTTPLGGLLSLFGGGRSGLDVSDRAVMAMNPTQ